MRIVGLTGGMGMGKSAAADIFRRARVPVFDADRAVHALERRGGRAVRPIAGAFPDVVNAGVVDRAGLRALVVVDPAALARLEAILHPLVREAERAFLARARREGRRLVVLDIPLLFETGGERRVDKVVVVSAPASVQRARLKQRGRMRPSELSVILGRQMPDRERRLRADHVVQTGLSRYNTQRTLRRLIGRLLK